MIILHLLLVIFGVLAVIFLGFLILDILLKDSHFIEKIALGYILGLGIFTLALFIGNMFGIPFRLLPSSLILLALIFISLVITLFVRGPNNIKKVLNNISLKKVFMKLTSYEKVILVTLLFLFCSSLALSIYWPIRTWDSLVLYDYRAKTFIATGFMADGIQRGYFFGYPLMTSLAHTWIYLLGGTNPLFLHALFYISFIITFYFGCRRYTSRTLSLIASTLLAVYPPFFSHSLIAYTNLPYTIYLVLGLIYLFIWSTKKMQSTYLILAALLIGLSTWVRNVEPFWYSGIAIVLIYSLAKKRILPIIYYLFFSIIIQLPWALFQRTFTGRELPQAVLITATRLLINNFSLSRTFQVLRFTFDAAIKPWLLILLAMLLLFFLALKTRRYVAFPMVLIIVFNLGLLLVGTYVASISINNWANISESVERLTMFFPALIIFYIFIVLFNKKPLVVKKQKSSPLAK
jgi:hypothetical protein